MVRGLTRKLVPAGPEDVPGRCDPKQRHLHHSVDEDPTLAEALDLRPGGVARRERVGGPWTREEPAS